MDKQAVFAQVAHLEERIGELYGELGSLKKKIIELLEENSKLQIENENLRNRMNRKSSKQGEGSVQMGEGFDALARLYHEGFHVCNAQYGSLRTQGGCMFCLSFLYKEV
ncbi:initiation-control protein YabA [Effusibacillus lacus]|uniref:Replication initiation control protein YabA n=1 Tax=Effusibacillus lacus TaxID=1348429 RepID=A0A292YC24_9BACL|nr:DNA replication initiation control protein YabA [Effusibacillus lacus]TCS74435.1 regulator of replication initiation timing [Effusibacillus lacus]GAX88692.1 initiation-control protein [Effusibacillus lacus]